MTAGQHSLQDWGWVAQPARCVAATAWTTGSCFETLRAYAGRVFALEAHLDRLEASARTVGMYGLPPRAAVAVAIQRMAHRLRGQDAVIRVMLQRRPQSSRANLLVMGRLLRAYPRRWYREGVAIATAVGVRAGSGAVPPQAKFADLLPGVLARCDTPHPLVELVYRTPEGFVGEGTVSNFCIVTKTGHLAATPPARGVLAGVTSQTLFRLAPSVGLVPAWQPLTRHEVWNAAEAFLTNTTFEVLPVVRYDGRRIGTGRPGSWTRRLHAAFRDHVRMER